MSSGSDSESASLFLLDASSSRGEGSSMVSSSTVLMMASLPFPLEVM